MEDIKKGTPEYKELSHVMRVLAKDIEEIFGYTRQQVVLWYNTPNIAFKGKKPVVLFIEGKGKIVTDYLDQLKIKRMVK